MNKKIIQALETIGLSNLEIACYLSLLQKSPQRATELAKRIEKPRATIHLALSQLVSQYGIVTRSKRKNVFEFFVEDPIDIIKSLDRKQSQISKRKEEISGLLPELRSMQQFDAVKPQIQYVEGTEAMKKVFLEVLEEADKIIGYGSNEDDLKYLPEIFPEYYKQRIKKKIPVKAIIPAVPFNIRETLANEIKHQRYTHLIPAEFNYPIQINIYKNKTILFSYSEKFVLIIKNKPITQCFKKIFEYAYEYTEKTDKEIRDQKTVKIK